MRTLLRRRRTGRYPTPRRDLLAHLDAEHWVPGRLRRDGNLDALERWHAFLHRQETKP